ncbi:phosphatidylserine decarboxylase [Lachnobacterium bovis]|uniref:Phosphatidylserine decarboxylase n=1 Tax=Lachnobacterium bovis TaxID=140626 RepID=A0A1H9P527_9FIRM|nr:phosphatidylserine decarboxylase [Lachnobacterium bovis]SER42985.1 phosphatidylserine decarboxylase [Lachnobacterium bovis]
MKCLDRQGNVIADNEAQNKSLDFLYKTTIGNAILKVLIKPTISEIAGKFLDSKLSTVLIKSFVKNNNIDLSDFEDVKYNSFNEFFTRKVKKEKRIVSFEPTDLVSPCDSRLSVYDITNDGVFTVKNTKYTMTELFRSEKIAKHYEGGKLLICRLTVSDYHRYHIIDDGVLSKHYKIKGFFHTVNPIANDYTKIYKENTREFSILKSDNFGNVAIMEVGALLVGRILNYHANEKHLVKRGNEKGRFEFGGSTVILAFEKDKVQIDEDILKASEDGYEIHVNQGEVIGKKFLKNKKSC